jgi:hypothetical protein
MRYVYGVLAVIIVAAGCIGADAAWISAEYLSVIIKTALCILSDAVILVFAAALLTA